MWPQWKLLNQQKFSFSLRTEDEKKRQSQWWRFFPFFAALVFFPSYFFDNDYYDVITDSKRHSSLDFYVESTSSGEIDRQRYFYMLLLSSSSFSSCSSGVFSPFHRDFFFFCDVKSSWFYSFIHQFSTSWETMESSIDEKCWNGKFQRQRRQWLTSTKTFSLLKRFF